MRGTSSPESIRRRRARTPTNTARSAARWLGAPGVARAWARLVSLFTKTRRRRERELFRRELLAKIRLVTTVAGARLRRGDTLPSACARAMERNTDIPPFVIEGIAHAFFGAHPGARFRQVVAASGISCPTQLSMLHVGLGMAIGERMVHACARAGGANRWIRWMDAFRHCETQALRGYAGCAVEALGLTARLADPELLRAFTAHVDPECLRDVRRVAYLYHGFGRGCYFHPASLLPSRRAGAKYRALHELDRQLERLRAELPAGLVRDVAMANCVAGVFWAITATSLRTPELLLDYVQRVECSHLRLLAGGAVSEGISANLVMLAHTLPLPDLGSGRNAAARFLEYCPADAADRACWKRWVVQPFEEMQARVSDRESTVAVEDAFRVGGLHRPYHVPVRVRERIFPDRATHTTVVRAGVLGSTSA